MSGRLGGLELEEDRLERWTRYAEWPLTVIALVFLAGYAIPIAAPTIPRWATTTCDTVVWGAWLAYAVDYLVRLALARAKWRFVRRNLLDLAIVALPLLRPLRLVPVLSLLSILNRTGTKQLRGRVVVYTVGATALLVSIGALAITDAERGAPGANIDNLGDGLWWALTTITTVGYGDRFPVTLTGRCVAAALMVGGIALLGTVTATVASWLVQRVAEVTESEESVTREQVDHLLEQVAALRGEVLALRQGTAPSDPQ